MEWFFSSLSKPDIVADIDNTEASLSMPHITHDILMHDEYCLLCRLPSDDDADDAEDGKKYRASVAQCFDQFVQHSPLSERLLGGGVDTVTGHLFYLVPHDDDDDDDISVRIATPVTTFPCIYKEERTSYPLGLGTTETYVVDSIDDHIYHYVIEIAMMGTSLDALIPTSMHQERQAYRERRMNRFVHQQQLGNTAVLYTTKTSAFYRECISVLNRNPIVCHDIDGNVALPLSYNLVSFLCGPLECDSVEHYDQWVSVPLYFIDLWIALRPSLFQ
jgi:hypothetical protein